VDDELLTPGTRPTLLTITLNRDGRPIKVKVHTSSGSIDLDEIAEDYARRMRFTPCMRDGVSVNNADLPFEVVWRKG
jgi:TonB family protein